VNQPDLLAWSPPSVAGSKTSLAAAEKIAPRAGSLRAKVLDLLQAKGPLTDEQMQDGLRMSPSTQRPRRIELVALGLVIDTGKTTKTKSGRQAVLWSSR